MKFCSFLSLNNPHSWAYSYVSDDDTYFQFAKCMIAGISKHHPGSIIFLLGINLDIAERIPLRAYGEGKLSIFDVSHKFEAFNQAEFKGWLVKQKIKFLLNVLGNQCDTDELLVYMDADCLLRRPLLVSSDFDIGFKRQHNKAKYRAANVGVLFLRNNRKVKTFIKRWLKYLPRDLDLILPIGKNGRTRSNEQAAFYEAFLYHRNKLKVWNLPRQYNDGLLKEDSCIWHGNKGDKLKKLTKFKEELSCMRNQQY